MNRINIYYGGEAGISKNWATAYILAFYTGLEIAVYHLAYSQKIVAFELWCWRRLLRVPWTARRWNQSILKEISPGCSLEGLMLKLKLQYFGHLMWKADSFGKTLMLGKIKGRRRGDDRGWDGWMTSPTQWSWINSGRPGVLWSMGSKRVRHNWETELNWEMTTSTESWFSLLLQ